MIHAAPERFEGLQSKRLEIKSRDFSNPLVCSLFVVQPAQCRSIWTPKRDIKVYAKHKKDIKPGDTCDSVSCLLLEDVEIHRPIANSIC